ncbi:MAG: NAD(P)-dependent oxidoreductase [Burkholderiaceae bacterium]
MTTLITGAGIIGCHTARLLAERGEDSLLIDRSPATEAIESIVRDPLVRVLAADVTHFDALQDIAREHKVRRVVHTAALLSTAIRKDPLAGIHVNVMGSANVLELARQMALERVVIASSATVAYAILGEYRGAAVPEDFAMHALTHRPASIYVATKVAAEHLTLLYRDLYGVSTVALRYAAVIGAWSGPGTSVPTQVMRALIDPARSGVEAAIADPYLSWSGGEDFIDARDCAHANVCALDAQQPVQGVYNIGLGQLSSFDDFADAVRTLYPDLRVRLAQPALGGFAGFPHVRTAAPDISAAARELDWAPRYSLAESVRHFAPLMG